MRDFVHDRKKNLDVVLCTPAGGDIKRKLTFGDLARDYEIDLKPAEQLAFNDLPVLNRMPVGTVLMALEAKATMTAHQRALPRLYDELNSSHATVHGSIDEAIAAAFVMVNMSTDYLSPDLNRDIGVEGPEWSKHNQPRDAELVIAKLKQLPRRSSVGTNGYDAIAIVVIEASNDGRPVNLVTLPPAQQPGDNYEYSSMINRVAGIYTTRFKAI